ncbi:MAG: AI-2E family transporter [Erysipelotrichaceae bacterium]|nr:AI-2E family transporter [Erysipelotrichaceae bacterium]
MKFLEQLYDKKYIKISVYVILTCLMTFFFGLIIYSLSGQSLSALKFIGSFMTPLVLGICIAYLLTPLVELFEQKVFNKAKEKSRRPLSVLLTFVIIIIALLLILTMLVMTVTNSMANIDYDNLMAYLTTLEMDFSKFWEIIESKLADYNISLGNVGSKISSIFNNISSGASTLLFANIFAIYFLLDFKLRKYWSDILNLFVSEKTRARLDEFARDADRVFSGYIRGQAIDAFMVGVMVTVALLIIRVPYAVVIGLLTGFGNLIPYVGPVIGFASLVIICLSEGSLIHLILGGAVLLIVMAVDGNIINPKLLSDNVEIHPVLVIVALLAGGNIGGIVGMLVAVPCAALLKLQFDKYIARRREKLEEKKD